MGRSEHDQRILMGPLCRSLRNNCLFTWLCVLAFPAGQGLAVPHPARGDSTQTCIAFLSDTQAPLFFETLYLKSNRNLDATRALLHDIVTVHPARLFLLGDLVSAGFYERTWGTIDTYIDSLRGAGVMVDAVLGNHELLLFPGEGEKEFSSRFPNASRTGYARTIDSVGVVLLNSNFDHLSQEEVSAERRWYERTMDTLDIDPTIRVVIVCCHHAPYSNSTIVGSNAEVQKQFVPPYLSSRKARLFISGHAHAFEHFQIAKKDFLVIGGGGGLLHPLREGTDREWMDLAPVPRPQYHYILVRRVGQVLHVTIRALQDDFTTVMDLPCALIEDGPPSAK
ncbi:MAG TPA: metallophosphoesterase [Bacteroidota bacterium]|nr:metallophosphoesterase [Bacteroidota bacterium]